MALECNCTECSSTIDCGEDTYCGKCVNEMKEAIDDLEKQVGDLEDKLYDLEMEMKEKS